MHLKQVTSNCGSHPVKDARIDGMILRLTVSQRKLFTPNKSTSSHNRDIGDGTDQENDGVDAMKSRLTVTLRKLFTANENESISSYNRDIGEDSDAESDEKENSPQMQTHVDIELVPIDNAAETTKLDGTRCVDTIDIE